MKKINIVILVFVIACMCLTTGCDKQNQPMESNNSILEEIAVLTDEAEHLRYLFVYRDGRYIPHPLSVNNRSLSALKIEHLGLSTYQAGQDALYTVFKLNDDWVGDYYTYVFFYSDNSYESDNDEDRYWRAGGLIIRISKHLSLNDFSDITIGSSISDVEAIDPATFLSIPLYYYDIPHDEIQNEIIGRNITVLGKDFSLSFDTFHYTDEGILCITFSRETTDDEFTVSGIELNSSFEVDPHDGYKPLEGKYPPIKLKIAPEHLPR